MGLRMQHENGARSWLLVGRIKMTPRRDLPVARLDPKALVAAVVEGSQDAIIAQSPDGIVLTWNPAAEAMYGFSAEEMIGEAMARIVPADSRGR